jgi:hypothetical protein
MDPIEDNTCEPDEDSGLDTSWIHRETQIQNIQNNYSREPMEAIHGIFIYINQNNYIEKIMREMITLTVGGSGTGSQITTDMLLKIIQTKKLRTPVSKYKFTSLFTHVIDIEPDKIQSFSKTNECDLPAIAASFFKEASITGNVCIPASIFIFHSINTVYFFFQEVLVAKHNHTLKSILKPSIKVDNGEPAIKVACNVTKKVRIFDKQDEKREFKKQAQKRGTRKRNRK